MALADLVDKTERMIQNFDNDFSRWTANMMCYLEFIQKVVLKLNIYHPLSPSTQFLARKMCVPLFCP
jgi:hypothetical protein